MQLPDQRLLPPAARRAPSSCRREIPTARPMDLPSGRWAISTLPSPSIRRQATTSRNLHRRAPRLSAVVAVDLDVFLREIARPHGETAGSEADVDPNVDLPCPSCRRRRWPRRRIGLEPPSTATRCGPNQMARRSRVGAGSPALPTAATTRPSFRVLAAMAVLTSGLSAMDRRSAWLTRRSPPPSR